MRLILLLASVLIIGLLVARQIGPSTTQPGPQAGAGENDAVQAPSDPGDLDRFADDMNRSVQESNQKRRETIEAQTR